MKKFTEDFKKMNLNEGKNNKRNKNNKNKKEENKIQKEPEEPKELTEEEKFKEELINIRDKIRELKIKSKIIFYLKKLLILIILNKK